MSILLDEICIDGTKEPGRVFMRFGNIDLNFDFASARKVAHALNLQADIAELEELRAKETTHDANP
jgi:hypothetical protein